MRQILFFLPILVFVLLPSITFGSTDGLVTCTGVKIPSDPSSVACGTCEFVSTIKRVFQFLITIVTIIATIILVYTGIRLVTSGGNEEAKKKAKESLQNIVIGLLFIIAAFAIVDVVMRTLVPAGSSLLNWDKVVCINAINPVNTKVPAGAGPGGPRVGAGAVDPATLTQCDPGNTACSVDALTAAGLSAKDANVMSCIAMTESSGIPTARSDSSTACGTYQFIKGTWESYASGACSDFSNCTNVACSNQTLNTAVSRNGYNDWTCDGCNIKAAACASKYGSG